MAINFGRFVDLVKLYAKNVEPEYLQSKLIKTITNQKLNEVYGDASPMEKTFAKNSEADVSEYELSDLVTHVQDVNYDGYRAHKITRRGQKELADEV